MHTRRGTSMRMYINILYVYIYIHIGMPRGIYISIFVYHRRQLWSLHAIFGHVFICDMTYLHMPQAAGQLGSHTSSVATYSYVTMWLIYHRQQLGGCTSFLVICHRRQAVGQFHVILGHVFICDIFTCHRRQLGGYTSSLVRVTCWRRLIDQT